MSDFNVHARIVQPQETTIKRQIAKKAGILSGGHKKVSIEIVGNLNENEIYKKYVGKGIVVKDEKSFQKMMKNHEFIPISMKLIRNNQEAGNLRPNEVVFVKADDLFSLRLGNNKPAFNKFYNQFITKKLSNSKRENIYDVKEEIRLKLKDEATFPHLRITLDSKCDQPIQSTTLQKAETFIKENPQVKLNATQREGLVSARTGGSATIGEDPSKKLAWLNAEEFIRGKAENGEDLNVEDLCKINSLVNGKDNCTIRNGIIKGGLGGPFYPHQDDIKPMMNQLLNELNEGIANKENPIVLSAKAYQKMVSIHPFDDGNGRTCRLLMDYVLLRAGLPPPSLQEVNFAIYGEQESCRYTPKEETPTSAVEMVMQGLKITYENIK